VIAVDSNVVVRLLVGDDPEQAKRATALFAREPEIFIAKTVVVETAWVLHGVYGFSRSEVAEAVQRLAGLPNVVVEDAEQLARALDHLGRGIDFADALHLAASPDGARFHTFDARLIRRGAELGLPVSEPLV
jgi:predicted nucleic-acid-binding protein